ncbi:GspE/PulE family protein [Armatimonas rosea]|uniref:Type IV pilus assembly protein PilB n=1 Tax=Armatimonas rosea TaxID=685828 RepID=A0A7W9STE2_ARMRO|nr:ATPase, T2SS/T4P/T4SS family [Armatimonas rosea]MBB6051968.1 type IV pilus assembly protein PilB [Armatimonas rosea]
MSFARKSLADILLEKQFVTAAQLEEAKAAGGDLRKAVIDKGFAMEVDVYKCWAESEGLPFVDITKHKPEPSALNVVPQNVVTRHKAIPVRKDGQTLYVAIADPRNVPAIDDIKIASRVPIVRALAASPSDIEAAIKENYGAALSAPTTSSAVATSGGAPQPGVGALALKGLIDEVVSSKGGSKDDEIGADGEDADAAPIIKMVNAILSNAIDMGASDIHMEPFRRSMRVRYRIDGVLREVMPIPKLIQNSVAARCKIMSDMNIAERRVPQDGRIGLKHNNKDYDMRVSCLPSMYGEKIVMRILDKSSTQIGLERLGFRPEVMVPLEELVEQPNGMFIVTGPTGSGKTTTLYSVLHKLNKIERNIITVEDPVEYELMGVTQVQINKKAGLNFSNALRCFLRQDPDIIMVGEMRDLETADIAVESALTGHLVLSTLHTNDAPSATMRLADMGVEPFLIAATLIGILAQRLGRTICASCKESYQATAKELIPFNFGKSTVHEFMPEFGLNPTDLEQPVTLYRGRGCDVCGDTGYKGRTGVHEMLIMNNEIADLIVRRAPLGDITDGASRGGMKKMREDGLIKILRGITDVSEVRRVVFTAGEG